MPGVGHFVMMEDPQTFNKILDNFINNRKFRRVITGHDVNGKSIIDGDDYLNESEAMMWITYGSPADNTSKLTNFQDVIKLEPPPHGSRFFYLTFPPNDPSISTEELEKTYAEICASLDVARPDTTRDPRMHITKTIDYIIILEGEVTLLMDEGEVTLQPFDVVIQRGTNHAWINRSSKSTLAAAIMIDAKPL